MSIAVPPVFIGPQFLNNPTDVDYSNEDTPNIRTDDFIVVCDNGRRSILIFNPDGTLRKEFGGYYVNNTSGHYYVPFSNPIRVSTYGKWGKIAIVDKGDKNHIIFCSLDSDNLGLESDLILPSGSNPTDVGIDGSMNYIVTDEGLQMLHCFGINGDYICSYKGPSSGYFNNPERVTNMAYSAYPDYIILELFVMDAWSSNKGIKKFVPGADVYDLSTGQDENGHYFFYRGTNWQYSKEKLIDVSTNAIIYESVQGAVCGGIGINPHVSNNNFIPGHQYKWIVSYKPYFDENYQNDHGTIYSVGWKSKEYSFIEPGTLAQNTTWSGNCIISGNVTVSGATLTITPGSVLSFTNGSSLIVNNYATVNANGTASSPITFDFVSPDYSTFNGINFNSTAMATINYCKILNAYRGIYENNWTISITNTAISNCNYGIYLYNSSPTILCCNIHNNINSGIYLVHSSPYLYNNYIRSNYYGVYCITNSNPKFGNGNTQGKNELNNYGGVYCWDNSFPMLGQTTPLNGGYNNFLNAAFNVNNASSGVVYAHHNWWNTTIPSNFKISGTGTTSYTNYLSSAVIINPAPPLNKTGEDIDAAENNNILLPSKLNKAFEMASSNNLSEARIVYLDLINSYPDKPVSYNALSLLGDTYKDNELTEKKDIFSSLYNQKGKCNLYAMVGLTLADIDKDNKLAIIDEVIEKYKGESIVELALFRKFLYYYFEKNDTAHALEVSKQLDNQFPESNGTIESHKILGKDENVRINFGNQNGFQNGISETPKDFVLFANYPNPFNPTTTIKFALPNDGHVVLEVYNILGEKISTLVNDFRPAGSYDAVLNGSNLASGIYIYRITANSLETGKVFVKSAKMLLLK
jgi:hypothetical protein